MSGLLGKAALAANTYTAVATISAGKTATANIRLVNRDLLNAAAVRVAICPNDYTAPATPADSDYIDPVDMVLDAGGIIEDIGISMSAGEVVVVYASSATVTVRVHGFES